MSKRYDVAIIGTGSAGQVAAFRCASNGKKVAIIDKRKFGGTCALRGCNPKKVLFGVAETIDIASRLNGKGISVSKGLQWSELIEFKKRFTETIPYAAEKGLKESGIDTYHGAVKFISKKGLRIESGENSSDIEAEKIVIATGSYPRPLNLEGEDLITTSDEFLSLKSLPEEIVFVGGGYISFEFAQIASRAGAKCRIVNDSDRPLIHYDADLVDILIKATKEDGIDVLNGFEVVKIKKDGNKITVISKKGDEFTGDMIVHGAGRIPDIEELDLEKGNIDTNKKGLIDINDYLQSVSNESVFVIGDANGRGPELTPLAKMEGAVVADNIVNGAAGTPDYSVVPSILFTMPSLSSIGITEEEAQKNDYEFEVYFKDSSSWNSTKRLGYRHSAAKLILDKKDNLILGAHFLSPYAGSLINIMALAMKEKISFNRVVDTLFAFPTGASDLEYIIK